MADFTAAMRQPGGQGGDALLDGIQDAVQSLAQRQLLACSPPK